jgi:hypothetical protein
MDIFALPLSVEVDADDVVHLREANGCSIADFNTHTQLSLDDEKGLIEQREYWRAVAQALADGVNPPPPIDEPAEIQLLRGELRKVMDARNAALDRKPSHKRTKDAELEFMCGAGTALQYADHPLKQMPVNWAFLMATGRDPVRS